MPDEPRRLLGLAGLGVMRVVVSDGEALDLEVECLARAGHCPRCEGTDLVIKERPVVAVRDLPLAGRVANLLWRTRRFRCRGCRRTHTEQHPALPARQRVSGRFRWRLAARAAGGGAHAEIAREEDTTCYQVARAMVRAPLPTLASGSPNASSAWRPVSGSTTSSGDRAARSWPTWPERVESTI